ncbi:MAG: hypothetical protein HY554_11065 [Elusimicrobia bacterium]|nr:hypothetical protein [Elusimicrobiota bacterium]
MTASPAAKARALAAEGDFEGALRLLEGTPLDAAGACLRVGLRRRLGQEALAERELDALLGEQPAHARANHLKGIGLLEAGRPAEAEPWLTRAEQGYGPGQEEERSELQTDLGNLHLERGDTVKAILAWRQALALAPANEFARRNLEQFDDPRFEEAATVNEMIQKAAHPAQVLAHLMRHKEFKTPAEAEDFANEILSLWNRTPRRELGGKTPAEASQP